MKVEYVIKRCKICGGLVKVLKNSNIICCGVPMEELKPNTVDAAAEKHLPTYEVVEGDHIFVKVNHVMEKDHYIEWIAMVTDDREYVAKLYPEQNAEARFEYVPGAKLYAYCNKHELWMTEVK